MVLHNFVKTSIMRDDSNLTIYIVAGIIIAHFLVGFVYLIYKLITLELVIGVIVPLCASFVCNFVWIG